MQIGFNPPKFLVSGDKAEGFEAVKSIKDYITVSISLAALVVSGVTFYLTRIHDPGISIEISPRLEWITDTFDRESLILPVTITNSGSRGHVVNQIVLEIRDTTKATARRYVASKFAVQRKSPYEFSPESLTAGSSVARSYLFERFESGANTIRPVGKSTIDPREFVIAGAGRYQGTLLVRNNGAAGYTAFKTFTFRITVAESETLRWKPLDTQLILVLQVSG